MVCTNVPGPPVPLYSCGRRMLTCYPHVPTGMDVGISVAVESYDQKLYFALTTDALAAPDGELMKEYLDASFAELRKAAGVPETEPLVTPARAPRKASPVPNAVLPKKPVTRRKRKPEAEHKPAAAAAAASTGATGRPSISVETPEQPAAEEALEDVTLQIDKELETVQ